MQFLTCGDWIAKVIWTDGKGATCISSKKQLAMADMTGYGSTRPTGYVSQQVIVNGMEVHIEQAGICSVGNVFQ